MCALVMLASGAGLAACGGAAAQRSSSGTSRTAERGGDDDGQPGGPQAAPGAPLRVLEGRASYYADSLAGRPTASGEPYDPRALTAASRDLPFGTVVRVVRVDQDGRDLASVVVRINDRGPHRDRSRILDLSRAAAEELDMIRAGVVRIRAEILRLP